MARQAPRPIQDAEFDFKEIKQRFFALNKARLQRTRADLRQRQQEFLELLPLLFHTNHPMLPGYVAKNTPAGIPDYSPGNLALQLAARLAKSFSYKRRAYRRYHIQALYMMGSTGTIAYSNQSDFDIWVCYDSDLKPDQIEQLAQKADAIEAWAQELEVDAHIFLVDPEQFRQGQHGALSSESSGSALHYLLLEEFYRTSLLLAGRYPIWWLVPPEYEDQYEEFVEDITRKRYIHSRDNIDFGGLAKVPAEEFYGATLWLLYKGINSPYKSVLKTLLMEAYASEYPDIDILGMRFKRAVYNGENEINKLDPYLMMLHKVEEYLASRNEPQRLDLIRRSFYFKVNLKLSETNGKEMHWRRQLLGELTRAWGWSNSQMFLLDSRDNWKIQRVIEERNALMHELTNSYRFLSDFTRSHSDTTLISARDLNLLGRKLYVSFERKAGKIDIIYRGITGNLYETHLSIHRLTGEDDREFWVVFSGIVNETEVTFTPPLKRANSLIEVLAWCYFNKIITSNTTTAIYTYGGDLTDKELKSIVGKLEKTFSEEMLLQDDIDALRQPAKIKQMLSVINAGIDPFMIHTRRGEHLTSNRTDSLRYGGRLENLANSIDQVILTTWNEVLTYRFTGIDGLFRALQNYIQWAPPSGGTAPPPINAVSYSSYRGHAIAGRIEELFKTLLNCFYGKRLPPGTRYVTAIEWDYYLVSIHEDTLDYQKAGNLQTLRALLARPGADYKQIVFDPQTLQDDVLPTLYLHNKPGIVQVFFNITKDSVYTYILDENGALYAHESEFYDAISLINQYELFFNAVHQRMQYLREEGMLKGRQPPGVAFYYLERDPARQWQVVQHRNNNLFKARDYINIQVICDKVRDEVQFTVYCDDEEYSSLVHGELIYKHIAEHILRRRRNHERYPIYITDIDLAKSVLGSDYANVQTIHYLNYKRHIENRLQQILEQQ